MFKDLTGERFGKIRVVSFAGKNKRNHFVFNCECLCGKKTVVTKHKLMSGHTKSCGCSREEKGRKQLQTHGMSATVFYNIWIGCRKRCNYIKDQNYKNYGSRGIKCNWNNFEDFKNDMHEEYQIHLKIHGVKNTTLERIDNNGNYCKENCRWATMKEQANNRRNTIFLDFNGRTTIGQLSKIYSINYQLLYARIIEHNWDVEKALTTPVLNSRKDHLHQHN